MTTPRKGKGMTTKTKAKQKAPAKKTLVTKPAPVVPKVEIPTLPVSPPVTASVFDKGATYKFTMGIPSFRAKVDKTKIDAGDADKALLSVGMKLIECEEYDTIYSIYTSAKKYLALQGIPTSLRESYYLIPYTSVLAVEAQMKKYKEQLELDTEAFIKVYDRAKGDAKKRLGNVFNETAYPSSDALKHRFYMSFNASQEVVPKKLEEIDPTLYKVHSEELAKTMKEAAEDMRAVMRLQLLDAVRHLEERLSGSGEEKKKVFRQSAITHVTEFLEHFEAKDVTDDRGLRAVTGQLKTLMKGVDAETLRDDTKFRERIVQQMSVVTAQLQTLVVEQPTRVVKLPMAVAS